MMVREIIALLLALSFMPLGTSCGSSESSPPDTDERETDEVRNDEEMRQLLELEFVGESSARIVVGEDHYFSIRARYDDGTNERIPEYEIATRSAVVLVEDSQVRGLQPGIAELTISHAEFELEATVEVLEAGPADFAIANGEEELVIDEGESFLVPYMVRDALGRELEEHPPIFWSVLNSDVVEIDQTGLLEGLSPGRSTVEASIDGTELTDTVVVRVSTIQPSGLVIEANTEPIMIDETYQARVYGVNAGREVTIYDAVEWEALTPEIVQVRVDPEDPLKASIIGVQLGTGDVRVRAGNLQRTLKLEVVPDGWKNTIPYERPCSVNGVEYSYDSMGREVHYDGYMQISTTYSANSNLASGQEWDTDGDGTTDLFVEFVVSGGRYQAAVVKDSSGTEVSRVDYRSGSSENERMELSSGNLPVRNYHSWYTDTMGRSVDYRAPREDYFGSYVFKETAEYDSEGRVAWIRTDDGWNYSYEFTWNSSDATYAEVDRWTNFNTIDGQYYIDRLGVVRTDKAGNWLYFNVYGEDGISWDYNCTPAPPQKSAGDPQTLPYYGPVRWGPPLPRND